jgi:hypothetical protein
MIVGVGVTAPADAVPFTDSIPLPVDFAPEGIAVGAGSTFCAGSLIIGDIIRGDVDGSSRCRDGGKKVNDTPWTPQACCWPWWSLWPVSTVAPPGRAACRLAGSLTVRWVAGIGWTGAPPCVGQDRFPYLAPVIGGPGAGPVMAEPDRGSPRPV